MHTELLKSALQELNPDIGEVEWLAIKDSLTARTLKRKDHLFQEGEVQQYIGFINQGLIREFFIDQDGDENTVWFFQERSFVTDYSSFLHNKPTKNTFKCLEETE